MNRHVTLFHCPHTRSSGVLTLLEELGADYELHLMNMHKGEQRQPAYLAINPMGKVPALRHGETIITEQVAVYLYLADLYADAGLTPSLDSPQRGAFLRWMVFSGTCFEPAVVDHALQRAPVEPSRSPYGDFATVLDTLANHLQERTWMLGDSYSVADVLWGTALNWTMAFGLIPERPVFRAYVERFLARPAVQRARARDVELAESQKAE
ncbi:MULTISPECIES: glutathione S-transferase family protein [Pseudomonas]|uniref:glutathione S-transferase family protein n=1 Tax=Pseudomonas TaxID=286 RepID=UPI000DA7F41F|nr:MULTISPECIES: glutathione S-transferase [Pseudomonas]MDW3710357.1 glutathione S-transferase [Pseudomonas sp. 2023EL-01195]PZE12663.1 glutathione S-transferase [Pseudomonas sp. 57B-090624]